MKKILGTLTTLTLLSAAACSNNTPENEIPNEATKVDNPSASDTSEAAQSWVEVFRATADSEIDRPSLTTEKFKLNGDARLHQVVTGSLVYENEPKSKAAEIMFQNEKINTESSHIDTRIEVADVGEKTVDLGERKGAYFLILWPAHGLFGDNWKDLEASVTIEQRQN